MTILAPRTALSRIDARLAHLRRIGDPESGLTVEQASTALQQVHELGAAPASILVRRQFLARSQPLQIDGDHDKTPRLKPALARLVRPRGVLLKLELILIFLAQVRRGPAARIGYPVMPDPDVDGSRGLIDLLATGNQRQPEVHYRRTRPGMRARQVTNALKTLAAADFQLVELAPANVDHQPFQTMSLNREPGAQPTGDIYPYKRPAASAAVVSIPIEFFTRGWIQVMTDSEIANWLMWRDRGEMRQSAFSTAGELSMGADTRLGVYDLTRDIWDTHQMLTRVGLMNLDPGEVVAPGAGRGNRFRRELHKFGLDDKPLGKDAHASMLAAVAELRDEHS